MSCSYFGRSRTGHFFGIGQSAICLFPSIALFSPTTYLGSGSLILGRRRSCDHTVSLNVSRQMTYLNELAGLRTERD